MAEWSNALELGSSIRRFESCSWHMTQIQVGIQTHISLKSNHKLFCKCTPSKQTCEICKGTPGAMPRFNSKVITCANTLLKNLNFTCVSSFEFYRKHYYYYDLPNSFQRTQHPTAPFARDGSLELIKNKFTVPLKYAYLEEDPAATVKFGVDYNRAGNPLLEIVTTPCFRGTIKQVSPLINQYLLTLERLCLDLDVIEKGLKSDINVSIVNTKTRYQIKNMDSFHEVTEALKQAIPILKEDVSGENKTFHYKNKLIYSRKKTDYLFSKEWNLKPVVNPQKYDDQKVTLHQIYKQLGALKLGYIYSKRIFEKIKHEKNKSEMLDFYLNNPEQILKKE